MIPDLPLDPDLPPALRRREFLRLLGAAGVATLGLGAPKLLAADEPAPVAKADELPKI